MISVILLKSDFNIMGINWQHTTDIIFCHEISFTTEMRLINITNRMGREKELNIHYI